MQNLTIQDLVNQHALFGMTNSEIDSHLRSKHSSALERIGAKFIPPPSKKFRELRTKIRNMDSSCKEEVKALHKSFGEVLIAEGVVPASDTTSEEAKSNEPFRMPTKADMVAAAEVVAKKFDLPAGSLEVEHFDAKDDDWRHDPTAYFEHTHSYLGPTLLDRRIDGFGALALDAGLADDSLTPFEAARSAMRRSIRESSFTPGTPAREMCEKRGTDVYVLDHMLAPWVTQERTTQNIQVEVDLMEILLSSRGVPKVDWRSELRETPFYVDIVSKHVGERTVSAIFCSPHANGDGFTYTVFVEWVGQGVEVVLFQDDGSTHFDVLGAPKGVPIDVLKELYDPIMKDIPDLVAKVRMHYKNVEPELQSLLSQRSHMDGAFWDGKPSKKDDKRARQFLRTNSYFRVLRVPTPRDSIVAGQRRNSWSLDHIVDVNGHFRWQPYGPGLSKHKLIWIDTYQKGDASGGRVRPANNPTLLDLRNLATTNLQLTN